MNKITADLWSKQACTLVMNHLQRGSLLEGMQTLLLCALREQGKGKESQAWLLLDELFVGYVTGNPRVGKSHTVPV